MLTYSNTESSPICWHYLKPPSRNLPTTYTSVPTSVLAHWSAGLPLLPVQDLWFSSHHKNQKSTRDSCPGHTTPLPTSTLDPLSPIPNQGITTLTSMLPNSQYLKISQKDTTFPGTGKSRPTQETKPLKCTKTVWGKLVLVGRRTW